MSAYVTANTTSTSDIKDQQIFNHGLFKVGRQKLPLFVNKVFLKKFLDLLISLQLFNRPVVAKACIERLFSLGNLFTDDLPNSL